MKLTDCVWLASLSVCVEFDVSVVLLLVEPVMSLADDTTDVTAAVTSTEATTRAWLASFSVTVEVVDSFEFPMFVPRMLFPVSVSVALVTPVSTWLDVRV